MRTIPYGLAYVQWARILLVSLIVCAILTVALAPTPLLSTAPHFPPVLEFLHAVASPHASAHLLVDGTPPLGPCGGGVAAHC
jgi:hypothetical protein